MIREDIENIYKKLLLNGAGHPVAEMVMYNDEMFAQYLRLAKEGNSDGEIAFQMQEELLKKEISY